jgi:hypothetical protein
MSGSGMKTFLALVGAHGPPRRLDSCGATYSSLTRARLLSLITGIYNEIKDFLEPMQCTGNKAAFRDANGRTPVLPPVIIGRGQDIATEYLRNLDDSNSWITVFDVTIPPTIRNRGQRCAPAL